jgi:hypothetical protein
MRLIKNIFTQENRKMENGLVIEQNQPKKSTKGKEI